VEGFQEHSAKFPPSITRGDVLTAIAQGLQDYLNISSTLITKEEINALVGNIDESKELVKSVGEDKTKAGSELFHV